jgi:predicted transcriptional regulator
LTLILNPEKKGLNKILQNYQIEALNNLWKNGEKGQTSRQTHEYVKGRIDGSISRASIINFLKVMADEGVLDYELHTGKGGMRRVYAPRLNESEFKIHVAQTVIVSLVKDFPEETRTALSQLSLLK